MKAKVSIAIINDIYLEEPREKVVFEKNGEFYIGPLLFKKDNGEYIEKVIETTEVNGDITDILLTAYNLMLKHGLKTDSTTFKTMAHWQYMNKFSDTILDTGGYDSDITYLKAKGII